MLVEVGLGHALLPRNQGCDSDELLGRHDERVR